VATGGQWKTGVGGRQAVRGRGGGEVRNGVGWQEKGQKKAGCGKEKGIEKFP